VFRRSAPEAMALGVAGAVLGAATGRPVRLAVFGAIIGGINGAIGGFRRTYALRTRRGAAAFVLDSSWALVSTAGALVAHGLGYGFALGRGEGPGFLPESSERRNRHVYARGFVVRRGFALTVGNVVSGVGRAGTGESETSERHRRSLLDHHEELHIWQARWFGPVYPLVYGAWMAGGAVVGAAAWFLGGRRGKLFTAIDRRAYWQNPFERWAYAHAAHSQRVEEAEQRRVER
jgi:hypothetical protein